MKVVDKYMPTLFPLVLVVLSAAFASGCKARMKTDTNNLSGQLVHRSSQFGLMQIIDRPEFRICMIYNAEASDPDRASSDQVEKLKEQIKKSYDQWLSHLSLFTGTNMVKKLRFFDHLDGCKPEKMDEDFTKWREGYLGPIVERITDVNKSMADLNVLIYGSVVTNSVILHSAGKQWFRSRVDALPTVVLHEIGHTIGLSDAYESIEYGILQPISIMNREAGADMSGDGPKLFHHSNGHLYPDDIYSLKQSYCRLYSSKLGKACGNLPYHAIQSSDYPRLGKNGLPAYRLGAAVKNAGCIIKNGDSLSEPDELVEVTEVKPSSLAVKSGLKKGDLIFE